MEKQTFLVQAPSQPHLNIYTPLVKEATTPLSKRQHSNTMKTKEISKQVKIVKIVEKYNEKKVFDPSGKQDLILGGKNPCCQAQQSDHLSVIKIFRLSLGNSELQLPPYVFYGIKIIAFIFCVCGTGAVIGAVVSNEWRVTSRASSVITATWVFQGLWMNCAGNALGSYHCRPHLTIFRVEGNFCVKYE
ncbi:unnamed protein product [Ranitomeya imitator]|uniref:Claudin n=1 Tax=Ranitomeya imitator TaxID=111125 RepID=A0ABN9M001_9NEOB|nr:unnamed protein product [Ranitomeya imitator]